MGLATVFGDPQEVPTHGLFWKRGRFFWLAFVFEAHITHGLPAPRLV